VTAADIREKVRDEDLEMLNISQISKITKIRRESIANAMKMWSVSHGMVGLAFVIMPDKKTRLSRREAVRDWLVREERTSAYVV